MLHCYYWELKRSIFNNFCNNRAEWNQSHANGAREMYALGDKERAFPIIFLKWLQCGLDNSTRFNILQIHSVSANMDVFSDCYLQLPVSDIIIRLCTRISWRLNSAIQSNRSADWGGVAWMTTFYHFRYVQNRCTFEYRTKNQSDLDSRKCHTFPGKDTRFLCRSEIHTLH